MSMADTGALAMRVNVANNDELGTVWRDPDQDRQGG